ncbi:chromate transporter [Skermanella stibiiresistens SB22]|uniref:Chromate transporter n=2 Tax=Skermanella TaxID=204447 RepID=W9H647_9PROT|nr:chromate transporter [Skermanella stibiiresistens SB22]
MPERSSVPLLELLLSHLRIGLLSFGGGTSGLAYHEVVVRKRWLVEAEFLSGLAICQILPGVNVVNLAVYVGQKLRGWTGAVAAATGLLIGPFFVVLAFGILYGHIIGVPAVAHALAGITAAAIGLMIMIVIRGARQSRTLAGPLVAVAIAVAIGVFHLPLVPVVLVGAPISIALAYLTRRRDA